ncbi:MAG TPA: hypothetical protein PLS90_17510 [Candidatus Sumerlaeota bacterium]|nr:MAG: hypothetical protein BWZ08_02627 [candidate division BRC1 bacterium ADurb.BinA292]HOE97861.1 hypothetical protein [Candidatus Sumerlaeota bacterium]HOR29542.1 hypothetical protein [Candidatus Sumerlaeota bacterium]HPK04245.1 hypothetical protein [Candidatus Sumerlaeota bacterium]
MADEDPQSGTQRDLIGHVWVESGRLLLTDPIYREEFDEETLARAGDRAQRAGLLNDGMAALFQTGIRIGRYPVYAHRFANGALARVEIDLQASAPEAEG